MQPRQNIIPEPRASASSASKGPSARLAELLVERGVITPEQLQHALDHQRSVAPFTPLSQIVVELGMAAPNPVAQALAASVGIPFVRLHPTMVTPDALQHLPRPFIEQHNLLPLSYSEGWLTVAAEDFANIGLLEDIARHSGCRVQVVAAPGDNIQATREKSLEAMPATTVVGLDDQARINDIIRHATADDVQVVESEQKDDDVDLVVDASDSPIVRLVNYAIQQAVEAGASDIHIEPENNAFRVRYRIDGELVEQMRPPFHLLRAVVSRIKIMAALDISERRLPQDGGMTVTLGDRIVDLRVSTMASKLGEKVVMRVVDRNEGIRRLDTLGFNPTVLEQLRAAINEPNGIVLVTGPTGSGKSTTLYAALAERVSATTNINTIEDPVERQIAGVNQFQINTKAGFTFASALRSLLRQDPDIIMVGEIRDAETARLATEAALTGHLVLSTLHTNDAPAAIPRLINMGVEPYLITASIRAVLAQRLVRQVCPKCKQMRELTPAERETLNVLTSGTCSLEASPQGAGCTACRGLGYRGRTGLFELLVPDEALLAMVSHSPSIQQIRDEVRRLGTRPLLEDGLEKVRNGEIGIESVLEVVSLQRGGVQ